MKQQYKLAALAAVAAFSFTLSVSAENVGSGNTNAATSPQGQQGQFSRLDKADQLIGSNVNDSQGNKLGTINDAAVDLESGRILYAVLALSQNNAQVAVPPRAFQAGQQQFQLSYDANKLNSAPQFGDAQRQNPGDMNYITQVYNYFGQPTWWTGGAPAATGRTDQKGFGNVQLASNLLRTKVQSSSNQDIGTIKNLALDFSSGNVIFVILQPSGNFGQSDAFYAIPPMSFTKGTQPNTVVTGIDQNTISSAPRFTGDNWQQLQNQSYAASVYRHYGKQPIWQQELRPTGRPDQFNNPPGNDPGMNNPNPPAPAPNNQNAPGMNPSVYTPGAEGANAGAPNVGASTVTGGAATDSTFGFTYSFRTVLGQQLRGQNNQPLARLNELMVDLESGHILYGLVSLLSGNQTQQHAVPPQMIGPGGVLKTDLQKLQNAPAVATNNIAQAGTVNFVTQVYSYFGLQPWWGAGTPTGPQSAVNLGNVHRASHLTSASVLSVNNQQIGTINDVLVNMREGRVHFLLLSPTGQTGQLYPVPPMAFTKGTDEKHLVTSINQSQLQSAPHLTRNDLKKLQDQTYAANVYQFYGKQAYWQTPTSSQPGSRVYPQNP